LCVNLGSKWSTDIKAADLTKSLKNAGFRGDRLREMRIAILPPDVNQSRVKFTVSGEAIRFGLVAIRGVGAKSAEEIIAVRERDGSFKSFDDFCLRIGAQLLNRRVLEALPCILFLKTLA